MRAVIVAAAVAFLISLFGTPVAIRVFTALKAGQPIRSIGLASNEGKQGTPAMGGVVFIVATVFAYVAGHVALTTLPERQIAQEGPTMTALVLLGLFVFCGVVGFLDDLLKVRRRNSDGLSAKGKLLGQAIVGSGFGIAALYVASTNGQTVASEHISLIRDISWLNVGKVGSVIVFVFVITAMSNGVNLTDGLDGLATGASILVLGAYALIGVWQYRHWCADDANARVNEYCYQVRDPLEIAMIAAAAAAPPLRVGRLERGQHRGPVLDRCRRLRGGGPGPVLLGFSGSRWIEEGTIDGFTPRQGSGGGDLPAPFSYTVRMSMATEDDRRPMSADDRKRNALEVYRLGMGQFEELVDTVDQLIFPVRWRAPQAVRRLPVAFTGIRLGGVTIGTAAVSGEVSALTTERGSYHVVMTTAGSVRSEHRANRVLVTPDRAAVYLPDGFTTASWAGPETCPMSVTIEPAVLHEELAGHLGHPISRPIELATSMSTADGMGRTWAALVRLIYDETTGESPSLACHPLIRSRLYDAVVSGLLLAADHQYREELFSPVPPMRPRAVRKAIDLLEAYPHQHLPVTTLARAVGVSTRTLQGGFRQHLGMTPMAYARSVRLARAHRDLQEADPQRTTVAAIAHRWGFSHLSRFAATYRNIYGTAPSKTLRS